MADVNYSLLGYAGKDGKIVSPYKNLINPRGYSDKMFYFPDGIPGFDDAKEFAFIFNDNTNPCIAMNFCGVEKNLSFLCLDPSSIITDYAPKLSDDDKMALNVVNANDVIFLAIVRIPMENIKNMETASGTINMRAPIAINPSNKYCRQIDLGEKYAIRHPLDNVPKLTPQ